jgi:vancomycin permeability regulator SanA
MTRDVSKVVASFVIQEARDAVRTYFAPLRAVADAFVRASKPSLLSQPVRSKPTEAESTL